MYWSNINTDIEKYIKQCATCLEFQQMQPKEMSIHHDIPLRLWELVGGDIFHFNNKNYLCVVDYNSKFPVVKRLEGLSAENHINIEQAVSLAYHHQSNRQVKTCIKFIKCTFKNALIWAGT